MTPEEQLLREIFMDPELREKEDKERADIDQANEEFWNDEPGEPCS